MVKFRIMAPARCNVSGPASAANLSQSRQDHLLEQFAETLLCSREDCDNNMQEFLKRVSYVQGQYDETESYEHLNDQLKVDVRSCLGCCTYLQCAPFCTVHGADPHMVLHLRWLQESMYKSANRIFFLSIPPGVFVDAAKGAAASASSPCAPKLIATAWMCEFFATPGGAVQPEPTRCIHAAATHVHAKFPQRVLGTIAYAVPDT